MTSLFKTLIIDLSSTYGFIAVSGKDAQKFLQGQLTSDIRQITATTHGLTAYCNLKGRIRALFKIFFHEECYYLQCPLSILSNTLSTLQKYARFSKVELQDMSHQWHSIGISIQPMNPSTSKEALFSYITEQNVLKEFLCTSNKKEILPAGQLTQPHENFLVLSLPDLYARFEILGSLSSIEALQKSLSNHIIEASTPKENSLKKKSSNDLNNFYYTGDFEAWKLLDIKTGIPEIWPQTVEKFLPHSLNLPALGAVSFNKGCYCGQEIIARMEHRANLKRHMFRAVLVGSHKIPLPGTLLKSNDFIEENVGMVIMASQADPKTIEILIETQDLYTAQSHSLFITIGNQDFPLAIAQKIMAEPKI